MAQLGAETGPVDEPLDEGGAEVPPSDGRPGEEPTGDGLDLDLAACPTVLRLRDPLEAHEAGTDFEQSLEALLDRLDRELSQ